MSETIITSLITGGVTLVVCMINNRYQLRQTDQKQKETVGLISYKLEELKKHVERTFIVEKRLDVLEERGKVANHRIEDLEHMNH